MFFLILYIRFDRVKKMKFPLIISISNFNINAHFIFEALSYFVGFRAYLMLKPQSSLTKTQQLLIMMSAIIGASLGSKALYWLEDPYLLLKNWTNPVMWLAGKTIAGGLIGGWIGVEIAKNRMKILERTGDAFVIPLIIGMSVGRLGCFFAGLEDHTYGIETSWRTGIDFGDGIYRHPTSLYEIAFLLSLIPIGLMVRYLNKKNILMIKNGGYFQLFFLAYFLFRFMIEFIKPTPHIYYGLNNIQVASAIVVLVIFYLIKKHEFLQYNKIGD